MEFKGEFPATPELMKPGEIGLIVGPSGCGKTSLLKHIYGEPRRFEWNAASVIDDFSASLTIEDITGACQAVGFNTVPAWMRPFKHLSNGEQFRVTLARHLVEGDDPITVDEFTSVVDRQVAKIASHAVQKHVRRKGLRFVACSCHYDIVDWLQPDWLLEPAVMGFERRDVADKARPFSLAKSTAQRARPGQPSLRITI